MKASFETPETSPSRLLAGLATMLTLAGLGNAASLIAQQCPSVGSRSFVCEAELYAGPEGERLFALEGRWSVQLELSEAWDLELVARDQFGRRFPRERLALGIEPEDRCRGIIDVDVGDEANFRIRAGSRTGDCRVWLWVPGNLNLEWSLDVRVVTRSSDDYSRTEGEYVTTALYRALLGRDPDPSGFRTTSAEIQRGNLAAVIRGVAASSEYRRKASDLESIALLEQIYQGLLGRAADSAGVRRYLSWIESGGVVDIVWEIVKSEEFERRMLEESAGG